MTLFAMLASTATLLFSPVDALVENALQVSTAEGSYITYFNADGTYTTNVGIEGTWELQGSEICVTRSTGESGCAPVQDGLSLGDSWEGTNAATGQTVTYTIVARD